MKRYDIVVIGLGRAGASVAHEAAAAGRKVAAVRMSDRDDEADRLSYALEGAAAPQPGPARFDVLDGAPSFTGTRSLSVAGEPVEATQYVIAVGATPRFPDGLDGVPLTSPYQVLSAKPGTPLSGIVLGGGPVATVVADHLQASGGQVTIVSRSGRLLPKEDESVSVTLSERLRARGIGINVGVSGMSISPRNGGFHARFCCGVDNLEAQADVVVSATGLTPNLGGLGLDRAGVLIRDGKVVVNDEMRTSNPRIFAAGHAVDPGGFLSAQDHHADIVATNLVAPFWSRKRVEPGEAPFSLRMMPPVARVGLTEAQAKERFRDVISATAPYFENPEMDKSPGMIKLVGRRRHGRLLGAHVVGLGAGELVLFFDLLLRSEIPIPDVPHRRHFPLPGPSDAAFRALNAWIAAAG